VIGRGVIGRGVIGRGVIGRSPSGRGATGRRGRTVVVVALAGPVAIGMAGHSFAGAIGPFDPLGSWALWLVLALGAVWMLAGRLIVPERPGRSTVLLIVGAGLLARAVVVPLPFITSTDAYRYLWDGRVQAEGTNPYRFPPSSPQLADLRDDEVYGPINRKRAVTIYPPVAQATFRAAHAVGLRTPAGWKVLLLAAEAASMALLLALAGRRRDLLLYAWNPVPIIAFGLAGHLDALVVLAVLAAALAWRRGWTARVGVALGLAAGLKLWPLLLLPAFARRRGGALDVRGVITLAVPAVAVFALSYLPYIQGVGQGVVGFLADGFLEEEGYVSGNRFQALQMVGITNPTAALIVAASIAGAVGLLVLRSRADAAARATWLFGTAVLLTTPYGWYATPLIALSVAGAAGALWAWFPLVLYAAYLSFFHNVWAPWLGERGVATLFRRAGLVVVALVLAAAAVGPRARPAVVGRTRAGDPASPGS
jgi:hypothetical protein